MSQSIACCFRHKFCSINIMKTILNCMGRLWVVPHSSHTNSSYSLFDILMFWVLLAVPSSNSEDVTNTEHNFEYSIIQLSSAMAQKRTRFDPRPVRVNYMVARVALGQSFLRLRKFSPPVSIIPSILHTHISRHHKNVAVVNVVK